MSLRNQAICYNYAMAACGRSGNDRQAEWLLKEMRLQGVTPNRISYSAAMFALGKAGRLPDVSQIPGKNAQNRELVVRASR